VVNSEEIYKLLKIPTNASWFYWRKFIIHSVPGVMCETSGECSLC